MTVYVDELKEYPLGTVKGAPRARYWCHMWADDVEELHEFAAKIGMRREWFQDHRVIPHYDLVKLRRAFAVKLGAVETDTRTWLRQKLK